MSRNPETVKDLAGLVGLKVWDQFVERACCDKKEVFLNGGWRGGKSKTAAFMVFIDIVLRLIHTPGTHLIWFVGPDYAQARQEYFYLIDWLNMMKFQPVGEPSRALQGPLTATYSRPGVPGVIEIATKQAGDPTTLGSVAPSIIVGCEAGQFSEEAMMWLYGRTAEKNATLIWSGTFENEDGKAQYAWFEEASEKAWNTPSSRQSAFRLPTWENLSLYDSCLTMISDDPSLTVWCPENTPHGESHSGLNHPMIRKLQDQWKDKPKDWRKRFGGEAVGGDNRVYEWANESPELYLVEMPAHLKDPTYPWAVTAGGMDFGTVHPSAITIGSLTRPRPDTGLGDVWVRESLLDTSGNLDWIWATKKDLTSQMHVSLWGADPMVKYNPTFLEAEAMSGSLFAREARVGICNGAAQAKRLFFDKSNPRVRVLFESIQRVHRRRNANGQVVYVRVDDDGPASWEDMMAMLLGQPILKVSSRQQLPTRRYQRQLVTPRSAS